MSESGSIPEKDFILLLITMYRDYPVLWYVKSKDYVNKNKRDAALKNIVCVLRQYRPDFDEEKLKKKINVLRTNFNKEYQKIQQKKASGLPIDDIQEPKLWYYNELLFIKDQVEIAETESSEIKKRKVPKVSRSNINRDDEMISNYNDSKRCSPLINYSSQIQMGPDAPIGLSPILATSTTHSIPVKRKELTNDVSETFQDHFKHSKQQEDRFDIFGKNVAMKLRDLPKTQRILAENIINDALFRAEIEVLTIDHKISGPSNTQQYLDPSIVHNIDTQIPQHSNASKMKSNMDMEDNLCDISTDIVSIKSEECDDIREEETEININEFPFHIHVKK